LLLLIPGQDVSSDDISLQEADGRPQLSKLSGTDTTILKRSVTRLKYSYLHWIKPEYQRWDFYHKMQTKVKF